MSIWLSLLNDIQVLVSVFSYMLPILACGECFVDWYHSICHGFTSVHHCASTSCAITLWDFVYFSIVINQFPLCLKKILLVHVIQLLWCALVWKNNVFFFVAAVDHMHQNGIFHRDIKPENILIIDEVLKVIHIYEFVCVKSIRLSLHLKCYSLVFQLADFGSCRGIYSKQPYTEYISTRW